MYGASCRTPVSRRTHFAWRQNRLSVRHTFASCAVTAADQPNCCSVATGRLSPCASDERPSIFDTPCIQQLDAYRRCRELCSAFPLIMRICSFRNRRLALLLICFCFVQLRAASVKRAEASVTPALKARLSSPSLLLVSTISGDTHVLRARDGSGAYHC